LKSILAYLKNIFTSSNKEVDATLAGVAKADALLQSLIDAKKIPGLAISVSQKNNVVFQKGYGFSDIENKIPVNAQKSIFRIASVSKPIAATALAKMVEEQIIDLDASLYDYVSYFPKKEYDFSIRQLASHTAGVRGYKGLEYGLNKPYSIKEGLGVFKEDDLLFKPGTDYFYNSYDWVLLSLAMQEVSNTPFEDYVKDKVLTPLGMENTFPELSSLRVVERKNKNIVQFYSKNKLGFRKAIPVNNFYKLSGGGYLSTTADILKLGNTYLNGVFLNPNIQKQFLTSQFVNGNSTYYGLGWQVSEDKKGRLYYGHIGNGVGGYSNFFVYPAQEIVISILINCTNPKIQDELDVVVDEVVTHFSASI